MALIEHFPFHEIKGYIKTSNNRTELNKNISLTIITSFTDRSKAILASQLEDNNIEYINASSNVDNFIKAFKPIYYSDALKDVNTEYVLIIDSYDTVINNIDNMPSCLEHYNKNIIYSSWNVHFPTYFNVDFSVPHENKRKYLNSGVLFGKTIDVKKYYDDLSTYIKTEYDNSNHWLKNFEQYWVYKFITENNEHADEIGLDYDEMLACNK